MGIYRKQPIKIKTGDQWSPLHINISILKQCAASFGCGTFHALAFNLRNVNFICQRQISLQIICDYLFKASLTATAHATVIPTMGLLPLTMNSPFFFCISFFAQKTGFFGGSWLPLALCGSIRCRKNVEKIFFQHQKSYVEKSSSYLFYFDRLSTLTGIVNH